MNKTKVFFAALAFLIAGVGVMGKAALPDPQVYIETSSTVLTCDDEVSPACTFGDETPCTTGVGANQRWYSFIDEENNDLCTLVLRDI